MLGSRDKQTTPLAKPLSRMAGSRSGRMPPHEVRWAQQDDLVVNQASDSRRVPPSDNSRERGGERKHGQ